MLLLRGHLAVCDMSHLQNWFSIVMTPVWPMAPLSRYFWPGSGSDRSNNSPANHLQYQSSPSLYLGNILDTMSPITPARPGHVASSGSEDICDSEDREISSAEVSIGVTWHVSPGYIAHPASPECWQILTTGCWDLTGGEGVPAPFIASMNTGVKDLTQ